MSPASPFHTARSHTLKLAASPADVAAVAAAEIAALLETAVSWRGEAHLCLSGGSTPRLLHQALVASPFAGWPRVHVWWGDERPVPPDHPESNVGMAHETLLDLVAIDPQHIHRLRGDLDPQAAAAHYESDLQALATRSGTHLPVMDVLVLGMGVDAHTASIFPGSPLLKPDAPTRQWCAAVHVPSIGSWRLSLTPVVLQAAAAVVVLVAGAGKRPVLSRVLRAEATAAELPIRLLEGAHGDVAWFVDEAALFG